MVFCYAVYIALWLYTNISEELKMEALGSYKTLPYGQKLHGATTQQFSVIKTYVVLQWKSTILPQQNSSNKHLNTTEFLQLM
jgi:hypothetical protein